jgi:hypothetical protein
VQGHCSTCFVFWSLPVEYLRYIIQPQNRTFRMHRGNDKYIKNSATKSKGKRLLVKPSHLWDDNIKMNISEI